MSVIFDGYSTTIIFGHNGATVPPGFPAAFREKTVTPFELDGGGPLDTTDMHNLVMRTAAPKTLLSSGEQRNTVYYDPLILPQLISGMQFNCFIVIRNPDGSGWGFWGWVEKFTPNERREGENPTAEMTIHASHAEPAGLTADGGACGVEAPPTFFAAGTIAFPSRNI